MSARSSGPVITGRYSPPRSACNLLLLVKLLLPTEKKEWEDLVLGLVVDFRGPYSFSGGKKREL